MAVGIRHSLLRHENGEVWSNRDGEVYWLVAARSRKPLRENELSVLSDDVADIPVFHVSCCRETGLLRTLARAFTYMHFIWVISRNYARFSFLLLIISCDWMVAVRNTPDVGHVWRYGSTHSTVMKTSRRDPWGLLQDEDEIFAAG